MRTLRLLNRSLPVSLFIVSMLMLFAGASCLKAESTLNFPRLSLDGSQMTGIAIANTSGTEAQVTFTAYGYDGQLITAEGFTNPVVVTIPANNQLSTKASDLFGSAAGLPAISWFQAKSPTDNLTGYFLVFNSALTLLDGADIPDTGQKLMLNSVRTDNGYTTELNIINPGATDANVQIQLMGAGAVPVIKGISIPARGVARLDVATFFGISDSNAGAYVSLDSDVNIAAYELVQNPKGEAYSLNARLSSETLETLYFLQMLVKGNTETSLGVINYSADPVILTISAMKPDGSLYDAAYVKNNPVTRSLLGAGGMLEDVASMFGFTGNSPLDGWISVKSTSAAINGYLYLASTSTGAAASVTTSAEGKKRALFSHIATGSGFYTGLTLLNSSKLAANFRVMVLKPTGETVGSYDSMLQPGQRFSQLLGSSDFIPNAINMTGGLIWVKSDLPLYMSSYVGTEQTLANIPPQDVAETYNPDAGLTQLKVKPSLAIVPPGASQRFQVEGGTSAPTWKVNGIIGGNSTLGTVNSQGLYSAPKTIPSRQVMAITAEFSSQSAAASADIITKSSFIGDLGVVQSVVYLQSLAKVYSAELIAQGASAPGIMAADSSNSKFYDITPGVDKTLVASFEGENIVKAISFRTSDSQEYALLLGNIGGKIYRVEPRTKEVKEVASGLNAPTSMVLDPTTGNLLVAEKDKVSTIDKSSLLAGTGTQAAGSPGVVRAASGVFPLSNAKGLAIDQCTGRIYASIAAEGSIVMYDPSSQAILTVVAGLNDPGQLLGVYRQGLTCPDSFHLLIVEKGANAVDIFVPNGNILDTWVELPGANDLAFLPSPNRFTHKEAVLISSYLPQYAGQIYLVELEELYSIDPPNPPETALTPVKTDVEVVQSHQPTLPLSGQSVEFTVRVKNVGSAKATGVILVDKLPVLSDFDSATSSQGTCNLHGTNVRCDIGSLEVGSEVVVKVTVTPQLYSSPGAVKITNVAIVSCSEVDIDPINDFSSEDVTVLALRAVALTVTSASATPLIGSPTSITVTAVDDQGYVDKNYTGKVSFSASDAGASLPDAYNFTSSDQGVHTFTNGVTWRNVGAQTVSAKDVTNSSISGSAQVTVISGPAASLQLVMPTSVTAGIDANVTVIARDQYGNKATGFLATVQFASSDPQAILPANYTFTAADGSSKTFAINLRTAGSQSVTVTAIVPARPVEPNGSLILTASGTVNVISGSAASIRFNAAPTSIIAGGQVSMTVSALDAYGNFAASYAGTVHFASSDAQASLPADYTFTQADGGTHSFTGGATLRTAGSQSLSATDIANSALTGSANITVTSASATVLLLSGIANPVTAGVASNADLTAKDQFGNTDVNFRGQVIFTSTDQTATLPAGYTFTAADAGVHSFSRGVILRRAGSQTVTATSGSISGSQTVTVNPGPVATLVLSPARTTTVAGVAVVYSATGTDQFGNDLGNLTPSTTFSISPDGSCSGASCVATVIGVHTVSGTNRGVTATTSLTVTPGPVNTLVLSPAGATLVAGSSQSFTATGYDIYSNLIGDVTATTTFSMQPDGSCTGATCVATVSGVHTVTGSNGAGRGTASLSVNPGSATNFLVAGIANPVTAGVVTNISVWAKDQYGNTDINFLGQVFFFATDQTATLPAGYTFTAGDAGVHHFPGSVILRRSGAQTVTVTNRIISGSQTVTVNPGAPAAIAISPVRSVTNAGSAMIYSATGNDEFGNNLGDITASTTFTIAPDGVCTGSSCTATKVGTHTVTGNNQGVTATATLSVNPGPLSSLILSPGTSSVVSGTWQYYTATGVDAYNNPLGDVTASTTFSILPDGVCYLTGCTANTAQAYTVTGTSGSVRGTASLTVLAGPAIALQVTGLPSPTYSGEPYTPTVTAVDLHGNVATTYRGTVRFFSSDSGSGTLPADYTYSAADNGVHTFNGVSGTFGCGTWSLFAYDLANTGIQGSQSAPKVGLASALDVSGWPTGVLTNLPIVSAGQLISVTATLRDSCSNIVKNYAGKLLITSSDPLAQVNPGGSLTNIPTDYTYTVADQGVHSFTFVFGTPSSGQWISLDDSVNSFINALLPATVVSAPGVLPPPPPIIGNPGRMPSAGVSSKAIK